MSEFQKLSVLNYRLCLEQDKAHAFQPDLGTHLSLTEKGFTRDICKISKVFLCANPGYAF